MVGPAEDHAVRNSVALVAMLMGFVLLFTGAIFFVNGVNAHNKQVAQADWPVVQGIVTEVERFDGVSGRRGGSTTSYDVYYEYVVQGQTYTGVISKTYTPREVGETLSIKYHPDYPNQSNPELHVTDDYRWQGPVISVVGVALLVVGSRLRPIRRTL